MGRVVWRPRVLLEVRVLRDVRSQFQGPIPDELAALPAIRKDGVPRQDRAGAFLVVVADLVNPGVLDRLSRGQQAIGLVKTRVVFIVEFHTC